MKRSILKPILAGVLLGTAIFFIPFFVLRVLVLIIIVGILFRLFGRRRFGSGWHPGFADKIRNMSNEEYAQYKARFGHRCGGFHNMTPAPVEK
ncbi:MAG TPA: hypothetical protein PK191_05105 [Niabella sp.]|nr:hypothetical protein [Niabella sp.]HOZ96063.1 hypothetical protein [Niabella sp.]HQW13429.1 hypothetical protein [Niabella sp.]HQX18823.1 hypothetical protein [Niabella sp.]HQX42647.1 hypothetical protein [Niabella sp.]